ncbi:MAG: hypothetical protein LCH85_00920 [Chloroflexi bacterium]|nr:hypothetical protein [Chloroflexota bacterium]
MGAKTWQIRQLQRQYQGIHDQEQYRHSVKSIIVNPPKHERDYLRVLAAIKAE